MAAKLGDAVLIEWEDSYGCSSTWQDIPETGEPHALHCKSLGWITGRSEKCLVIVPHLAQNGDMDLKQGCGDMTIPTAAIRRITKILLPR
jgi:hypothetical protein